MIGKDARVPGTPRLAYVVGVAHTGITTSDINRSIRFFRDVLGATATEPILADGIVTAGITGVEGASILISYVALPGHTIELLEYLAPDGRQSSTLRPCDSGHLHLSLIVNNIEELLRHMQNAGFSPAGQVQHVKAAAPPFKAVYTYGPDGLVIELLDFSDESDGAT